MNLLGYELVNAEKLDRAINGSMGRGGRLTGGVGEDAADELIIAAYDRLGGLIRKNGDKVQHGCFCDMEESKKQGKPVVIEDPFIVFEFRDTEGNKHLVDEDEDEPDEVKMAKLIKKEKSSKYREEIEAEAKELKVKFVKSDKTSAIKNKIRVAKRATKKEATRAKRVAAKEEAKAKKEAEQKAKEEVKKE